MTPSGKETGSRSLGANGSVGPKAACGGSSGLLGAGDVNLATPAVDGNGGGGTGPRKETTMRIKVKRLSLRVNKCRELGEVIFG